MSFESAEAESHGEGTGKGKGRAIDFRVDSRLSSLFYGVEQRVECWRVKL